MAPPRGERRLPSPEETLLLSTAGRRLLPFRQHVAEEPPLLDGVVQGDVGVSGFGEPAAGHVALGRVAVGEAEQRHGEGLDVQRRVAERALAGEADQVPIDEEEVVGGRIADEDGTARQLLEPGHVPAHGRGGRLQIGPRLQPGLGVPGPPVHRRGVARGPLEQLEVGGEGGQELARGRERRGAEAQHGMGTRDRAVGLDVGGYVDLLHEDGARPLCRCRTGNRPHRGR